MLLCILLDVVCLMSDETYDKNEKYYRAISELVSSNYDDSFFGTATMSIGDNALKVDNRSVKLHNSAEIQDEELIVPLEALQELGVQVSSDSNGVILRKKNRTVEAMYGEKRMKVMGNKKELRSGVSLKNGRPVLPASIIADQGLGFEVGYEKSNGTITITNKYQTARLIVKFTPGKTAPANVNATQTIAGSDGQYVYQFDTAEEAKEACEILSASPDVIYAEPDLLVTTASSPSPMGWPLSWGTERIGTDNYLNQLIAKGKQNASVKVAVVDTGLDAAHPFLNMRQVPGYNFVNTTNLPIDDNSHGTHVSGTIVDVTIALPNVKIMPVKVLNADGNGTTVNVANGVRWAADKGANVINMSLSGGHSQVVDDAIDYAISMKVAVVVAAGNSAMDANSFCPSHNGKAITVSAVDGADKPAYFTNFGSCVDVAAPGVNIISTIPGRNFGSKNGTSMASPHVAGAVAMLLCEYNSALFTPAITKNLIRLCVDPIVTNNNRYYGTGILNMKKIVLPAGIMVTPTTLTFILPSKWVPVQVMATVLPSYATDKSVTWSSSNSAVVTVSNSGLVSPVAVGSAVITAKTINGLTAVCNVTIMRLIIKEPIVIKEPIEKAPVPIDTRRPLRDVFP